MMSWRVSDGALVQVGTKPAIEVALTEVPDGGFMNPWGYMLIVGGLLAAFVAVFFDDAQKSEEAAHVASQAQHSKN